MPPARHAARHCLPCSLLLLGFLLPVFVAWTTELRERRQLLARHCAGTAPSDARRLHLTQQHLPGLADFAMFAVPAVAAMYSLVVAAS